MGSGVDAAPVRRARADRLDERGALAYRSVAHFPAIVAARSRMIGTNGIRTRNSPGQNRGCLLALLTHPWVIDVERLRSGSLLLFDRRPAGTAKIMGDPIEPSPPTKLRHQRVRRTHRASDHQGDRRRGRVHDRRADRPPASETYVQARHAHAAGCARRRRPGFGVGRWAIGLWDVTPVGRDWARAAEQRAALHSMVALRDFESSKPAAAPVEDRG